MEELQQLSLASKVPGQKMQVIVSLFSVPRKGCTCCGTTVLAGNLNGNGNSPVMSSLFRWGSFSRLLSKGQLLEQERPKRSKMFESCRGIPDSDTFPGQLLLGMLLVRRGKGWCYCCALIQPVAKGLLPVLWQDPFFSLNAEQLQFPALVVWDLTFFPQSAKNEQHGWVWYLFGTSAAQTMEVKLSQSWGSESSLMCVSCGRGWLLLH